jgi:hypothetical protein
VEILNTLAPVFLLIALGAGLQRAAFVPPNFLKEANRVTYWVGLPALLFSQLAASFHQSAGAGRMLGVMLGATGAGHRGRPICRAWLMRVPGAAAGTFVQGAFRGNLAFVGLPVIYALPDTPLAGRPVRAHGGDRDHRADDGALQRRRRRRAAAQPAHPGLAHGGAAPAATGGHAAAAGDDRRPGLGR